MENASLSLIPYPLSLERKSISRYRVQRNIMTTFHTLSDLPKDLRAVFGIGFFDGCHLGHQAVFEEVKRLAAEKEARPALITFYPHPMTILAPDIHVPLLQSEGEKLAAMEEAGMDMVVCIRPDREFLSQPAEHFLEELAKLPGLCGIVTGENFTFGRGALGNGALMASYFKETKITVRVLPLSSKAGMDISSTAIRSAIHEGRVKDAALLLGRPYTITGDVVHGFQRGHSVLGFPTANLDVQDHRVIPADGVYATRAIVGERRYGAITNVGNNPTFGNDKKTIETFIFDFDESIYGRPFTLEWVDHIRGEKKFESPEALVAQIGRDIEEAKALLC